MTDLTLVPFGLIAATDLHYLARDLSKHDYRVTLHPAVPLRLQAYTYERRQYRADRLLKALHCVGGERVLAVTDADIYMYVLDFIKGYAELPGRLALISLARLLAEPQQLRGRSEKLALHELGHTDGLEHCRDTRCVMHAAESMADIDSSEACFCAACVTLRIAKKHTYLSLLN